MEEKVNIEQEEKLADEMSDSNAADETSETTETPSEQTEPEEEKDPLEVANEQIADLKDKYLRQVAEFVNYRKRTLKERAELILNGGEKVITTLLPVLD